MHSPSRIDTLASALGAVIKDPSIPSLLRDSLFLIAAQLRDKLPPDQARTVDAAEAEAVISSFVPVDPTQSPPRPDEEIPSDES